MSLQEHRERIEREDEARVQAYRNAVHECSEARRRLMNAEHEVRKAFFRLSDHQKLSEAPLFGT